MLKKLIFITCMFFCISSFSESQISFTQSENLLYKDIVSEDFKNMINFEDEKKTKDDIDTFLLKHKLSVQELYNFLNKKKEILNTSYLQLKNEYDSIDWKEPKISLFLRDLPSKILLGESSQTHGGGHASTIGAGAIIIALFGIPWIIGMPILLSGIAIQRYATPSTTNKAISLGLMATGGLLSLPGNIIGLSIPSGIIEEKLLNISFRSRIHAARHRLDNVRMELDLIKIIIRDLERLYS